MELRVLHYFLSVAREESITGAAKVLNVSQPALSRQLKALEEELNAQLIIRGSRKIELTEEGMLLKKRAEEILTLVQKAKNEVNHSNQIIAGDIYIGTGESESVQMIAKAAKHIQMAHPDVRFHIITADSPDIADRLEHGLIDIGLLFDPVDMTKYNGMRLPTEALWGLMLRRDDPLAIQNTVSKKDMLYNPLIVARHVQSSDMLHNWLGSDSADINIVATYNLFHNCSLLVEAGLGYALCIDGLLDIQENSVLCFRPFYPEIKTGINIVWKKHQILSKPVELFLSELTKLVG